MKQPLDTKRLQKLCEAVARDTKGYNEGTPPKAQDDSWARLVHESLPELEAFMSEKNADNKQICLCECHQRPITHVMPCCKLSNQIYMDKQGNVDIEHLANLRSKLTITVDDSQN